jgi:hypothetical protein
MKVFHCDHCGQLLFFENTHCVSCQHQVAFLPDLSLVGSLDPDGDQQWTSPLKAAAGRKYRLCCNYADRQVCNWAIPADDPNPLCVSCRLTRIVPDTSDPENHRAWYRLEVAKRRLVFTLLELQLPVLNREEDPEGGLAFEFLADANRGDAPVLTGHANGVITVNIAEADDAERERRRTAMHEPYRTLLGHMRHESGHYFWDRLIQGSPEIDRFRELFGDERADYAEALRRHYDQGPAPDWPMRLVSAYASVHPWEDWAETWAHYLHMVDTLETAAACGMSLRPVRSDEPALARVPASAASGQAPFDQLIDSWFPLTYALNNLNRGLGLSDAYPFVLPTEAVDKLRYVHDLIGRASKTQRPHPEEKKANPSAATKEAAASAAPTQQATDATDENDATDATPTTAA